jgi:SdpI/YfhL protein family
MRKQTVINLLIILVTLSPAALLLIVWKSIPLTFVTKFEFSNSFEKIQSRQELLIAVLALSVASALLYLLMRNLRKIDPKVNESTPRSSFHKLGLIITLFVVILNYFLILSARNDWTINNRTATGFFGLLVALIGNYMNNLKPNYFAGIRLPWTLNDPDNWKQTHQLAGKLWFAGGIVLVFCSFILPEAFLNPVGIGLLVVLVVIPGIYSYRIFRSKRN